MFEELLGQSVWISKKRSAAIICIGQPVLLPAAWRISSIHWLLTVAILSHPFSALTCVVFFFCDCCAATNERNRFALKKAKLVCAAELVSVPVRACACMHVCVDRDTPGRWVGEGGGSVPSARAWLWHVLSWQKHSCHTWHLFGHFLSAKDNKEAVVTSYPRVSCTRCVLFRNTTLRSHTQLSSEKSFDYILIRYLD